MGFNRPAGQSIETDHADSHLLTMRRLLCRALAVGLLFLAAPLRAQVAPPTGEIVGVVSNAETGRPARGVRVSVETGGTTIADTADDEGRFRLRAVPVGSYLLLAIGPRLTPALQPDVVVTAGRQTQVMLTMSPGADYAEDVVVRASVFTRPIDVATGTHALSSEEIRRAPGGLGDVSRLTQSLPGVVSSSDQRNDIVARGGSPSENLTLVDGIEVPNLNHFAAQGTSGGPISMLNTDLIQSATFLAGGFPAAYGDRLSSVLDVSLREGSREQLEADIELGFAGFGAVAEGPIGSRGSFLVSARRSYLELLAPAFGLTAVPRYTNVQGKAVVDLSPRHRLSLLALGGMDRIVFDVDETDLEDPSLLNVVSSGRRSTEGLVWRSLIGDRGIGTLAVSHGVSTYRQLVRDAQIGNQTILDQDSRESTLTAHVDLTYRTASLGTLKGGLVARRLGGRLDIAQPIGLDNPFSTDVTRVDAASVETSLGTGQASAYLQSTRAWSRWVDVTVGGRVDRFAYIGATTISPRVNAVAHVTPTFDLTASYGRYSQMPALVFLNAAPVNRELDAMRSSHRVVGLEWRPAEGLRLTVEGYQKDYWDYPVSVDYPTLSLANTGDFYGIGGLLVPLVSGGTGQARGVELFVQQKLTRSIYGQIAYSHSRTEHAALDGVRRRGGFDTPQVLSIVGGRSFNHSLELSTKLTIASGRPTTPFLTEASRAQNRGIYDLSQVNGERGPRYQRWDVRLDRRSRLSWASLVTWVEVENLLGRKNVYQYVWNPKTRDREPVHQIGRFIIGGFTFEL